MTQILVPVDPNGRKPIYIQIADYVTSLARNGQLQAGDRLPASRTLAEQVQVHRGTVVNAYEELKARGVVETRRGSGSFIAAGLVDRSPAPSVTAVTQLTGPENLIADIWRLNWQQDVISLALALPAEELAPVHAFERARQRVIRRDGVKATNYEDPQGYYPLRQAIAADLARHGILTQAEEVIITAGARDGLALVANALAAPGDVALSETPAFFGTLFTLGHLGIQLLDFGLTESGPEWASLDRQLASTTVRPRFASVVPDHHNPTGICWTMAERYRFLQRLSQHDIPVIEDATYRELSFDGPALMPLRALDPEVIYIGSFSKTLMPGLRIGFVVANGRLRDHLVTLKTISSGSGDSLSQRTLAEFLTAGGYAEHLEHVVSVYRGRRNAMLEAMAEFFPLEAHWTMPAGGLHLWVTLPDGASTETLYRRTVQKGVAIAPAAAFYAHGAPVSAFRMAFSRYPEDVLRHAVRTVGDVVKGMR
jgi:GntR family transcriptional regulator/MocR family aminotransferase